jgi:hypothetical protein
MYDYISLLMLLFLKYCLRQLLVTTTVGSALPVGRHQKKANYQDVITCVEKNQTTATNATATPLRTS